MPTSKTYSVLVAETAPIIMAGLIDCFKSMKEIRSKTFEAETRDALFETIMSETIDLLVVNPSFGGLIHPDEIRKNSRNTDIKIIAIEIGKLSRATISLYDDYFHISDDLSEIRNKINAVLHLENEETEEKESLSSREKEIISHVVKGFTNQEIADKLFLSVHTVMTHRRNIARKLQIHSATGLTIYAIVNKIVELNEIKL